MKHPAAAYLMSGAILGASLLAGPAATAAPPTGPDPDFDYTTPAGSACPGFDLWLVGTDSGLHRKEFTNQSGDLVRVIGAGRSASLTFTNLDSGKSLVFKSRGSVQIWTLNEATGSDTVAYTGHNALILFDFEGTAEPTTTYWVGRSVYTFDGFGGFTLESSAGKRLDICAALE